MGTPAKTQKPATPTKKMIRCHGGPLRQLADGFLQQGPRLLAVFSLPFGIEPGGTQFFAEWWRIRLVERQSLARQVLAQTGVQLCNVGALVSRRCIDVLGDDGAHILSQV